MRNIYLFVIILFSFAACVKNQKNDRETPKYKLFERNLLLKNSRKISIGIIFSNNPYRFFYYYPLEKINLEKFDINFKNCKEEGLGIYHVRISYDNQNKILSSADTYVNVDKKNDTIKTSLVYIEYSIGDGIPDKEDYKGQNVFRFQYLDNIISLPFRTYPDIRVFKIYPLRKYNYKQYYDTTWIQE